MPSSSGAPKAAELFRGSRQRTERLGRSFTWLCGGALALNLLLVIGILVLLALNGLGYFWQKDLVELALRDGRKLLGEIWEVERTPARRDVPAVARLRIKTGNRDVDGLDFAWIEDKDVVRQARPAEAVLLERLEWGNFHGYFVELRHGAQVLARGPRAVGAGAGAAPGAEGGGAGAAARPRARGDRRRQPRDRAPAPGGAAAGARGPAAGGAGAAGGRRA